MVEIGGVFGISRGPPWNVMRDASLVTHHGQ